MFYIALNVSVLLFHFNLCSAYFSLQFLQVLLVGLVRTQKIFFSQAQGTLATPHANKKKLKKLKTSQPI